jgi:hypothetical protein
MGHSRTTRYRIEIRDAGNCRYAIGYDGTPAAFIDYIGVYNSSFEEGGVNAHIGPSGKAESVKLIAQTGKRRGEVIIEGEF